MDFDAGPGIAVPDDLIIYTIGHSTRQIDEFVVLLSAHDITQLVDIRTIPRSRHNPQYEQAALRTSLPGAGIKYHHLTELGGLRPSHRDSTNGAWRNQSFRNYADHMQTAEFEQGLAKLVGIAAQGGTAIMCAEAVPWRCHRSLVADALLALGVQVFDIIGDSPAKPHAMTSFAVVSGGRVSYPPPATD